MLLLEGIPGIRQLWMFVAHPGLPHGVLLRFQAWTMAVRCAAFQ